MSRIFGFTVCGFFLFALCSCRKDFAVPEFSKNTEGVFQSVEDEIDSVFEFNDDERDTISLDNTDYNADANVTLITSVTGQKAIGQQGIETNLGCDKYKYYGRYIVTKQGGWFDITLNRDDSIKNVANFGDGLIFDSLYQTEPRKLKVRIRTETDTLQTKTSSVLLFPKKPWSNGVYPSIRWKMKFVGKINEHLYGNNGWMEEYWRIRDSTQNALLYAPIIIDNTYEVRRGDILVWGDGHTGTVMPNPTPISYIVEATKSLPRYRVNRFWLSEMNSRCKGEKTVKAVWMKSYKPSQTLISANKLRGSPTNYYRVRP